MTGVETYEVLLVLLVASRRAGHSLHLLEDGVRLFCVKHEDSFAGRTLSVYTHTFALLEFTAHTHRQRERERERETERQRYTRTHTRKPGQTRKQATIFNKSIALSLMNYFPNSFTDTYRS